jgi:predicted phage terminase large subunit-like protein
LWILIQESIYGLPGLEHRILLTSFSAENARKQIRSIQQQVERNDLLRWLFPEILPDLANTTWRESNLLFPRQGSYGEDTIEAAGVDTHIVSRHYTVQIKDDLEDQQSAEQPTVRARVKTFYKACEALFVDERAAVDILIGTRWGVDDLYADIRAFESDTYQFYTRPLHWTREDLITDQQHAKENREPLLYEGMTPDADAPDPSTTYYFFPELFPEASCRRIRAKQGAWMYSMLYLNNPRDPSMAEFKEKDLRYFGFTDDGDLIIEAGSSETGETEVVPFDSLRRVEFWDPALSEADQKHGCRNAIVVLAKDRHGRLFLLEAWAERKDPTALFSKYIGVHQRYRVHTACIEDVAFQRVLKFPLYQKMRELDYSFPVRDVPARGDKDTRIRALIPYCESHLLYVKRGLKDFLEELRGFPVFPTKDLLDAASACVPLFGLASQGVQRTRNSSATEARRLATRSSVTGY